MTRPRLRRSGWQTIREIGDDAALDDAVDRAFPGSSVQIADSGGRFELRLRQPGLLRPLRAAEVSDGTLRYLLWIAALLTPRPPELLVLNEPETSLHPDLIGPLADLVITAAARAQIIVVTHTQPLVTALRDGSARTIRLTKDSGRTLVDGQGTLDEPAWHWPGRLRPVAGPTDLAPLARHHGPGSIDRMSTPLGKLHKGLSRGMA